MEEKRDSTNYRSPDEATTARLKFGDNSLVVGNDCQSLLAAQ